MGFKRLVINNKAVSPVIGVILMVAITIILAATFGSSVFGQETAESAPQVSLSVQPSGTYNPTTAEVAKIKFEHLGGDAIKLDSSSTKILIYTAGTSQEYTAVNNVSGGTTSLTISDIKEFNFETVETSPQNLKVKSGQTANIKLIDKNTSQIFFDRDVIF